MLTLNTETVKLLQRGLGLKTRSIDGILGQKTESALDDFLNSEKDKLHPDHRQNILRSGRKRKATAFGQIKAIDQGIDAGIVDGYLGAQTDFAIRQLIFKAKYGRLPITWRDHQVKNNPNNWPVENHDSLEDFYGKTGRKGKKVPLKKISLPYPHKLSWHTATVINEFSCHEKVADSIQSVLEKVLKHYGLMEIQALGLDLFGGCFNYRRKRGGSSLSTHAWGIAVDYHPDKNRLYWEWDQASFAQPTYDFWWQCWEKEGWISLGRFRNFDWMHIQAARLS